MMSSSYAEHGALLNFPDLLGCCLASAPEHLLHCVQVYYWAPHRCKFPLRALS